MKLPSLKATFFVLLNSYFFLKADILLVIFMYITYIFYKF